VRALLQRVDRARVQVGAAEVASIGLGVLVFLGCAKGDGHDLARRLARKVARYRLFPDQTGRSNLSVRQVDGAILLVPQFTLAADTNKGNRPSFDPAMPPEQAEKLVKSFAEQLLCEGVSVHQGLFGAEMLVELVNHGPATYLLELG
jgi:D-aminoacyl-tRNA deacylase